jgi:hypothetical protein
VAQNTPGDAGEFVGKRHREFVSVQSLGCSFEPCTEAIPGPVVRPHQEHLGSLDQQRAQVPAASLGDTAEESSGRRCCAVAARNRKIGPLQYWSVFNAYAASIRLRFKNQAVGVTTRVTVASLAAAFPWPYSARSGFRLPKTRGPVASRIPRARAGRRCTPGRRGLRLAGPRVRRRKRTGFRPFALGRPLRTLVAGVAGHYPRRAGERISGECERLS